jgi:hypothetical protein
MRAVEGRLAGPSGCMMLSSGRGQVPTGRKKWGIVCTASSVSGDMVIGGRIWYRYGREG